MRNIDSFWSGRDMELKNWNIQPGRSIPPPPALHPPPAICKLYDLKDVKLYEILLCLWFRRWSSIKESSKPCHPHWFEPPGAGRRRTQSHPGFDEWILIKWCNDGQTQIELSLTLLQMFPAFTGFLSIRFALGRWLGR